MQNVYKFSSSIAACFGELIPVIGLHVDQSCFWYIFDVCIQKHELHVEENQCTADQYYIYNFESRRIILFHEKLKWGEGVMDVCFMC